MVKLIRAILFVVGLVLIVVLSVANRQPVEISFWPLPQTLTVPLYAVFLFTLAMGVILGGLATWVSRRPERAEARRLRRKVKAVEYQERLRREAEEQALVDEARRKTEALALSRPASGALVPARG